MIDPNWLLSTCAQSAAALVAIIGGFIVSKLLGLSVERNSIKSKLRDIQIELDFKVEVLSNNNKKLLDIDAEYFIDNALDDIVEKVENISLSELVRIHGSNGLTEEELKPYYEHALQTVEQAYEFFTNIDDLLDNFDQFIKNCNKKFDYYERKIYKHVYKYLKKLLRHRNNIYPTIDPDDIALMNPNLRAAKYQVENQEYNEIMHTIDELERECNWLDRQKSIEENKLSSLQKPEAIIPGIIAFGYFSIVGIIYPICLLPMSSQEFTYAQKWVIVSLFTSGFIAVFSYILYYFKKILK